MAEALGLSKDEEPRHAEDYDFLRRKGIEKIQALCGDHWTDYNEHDPGITLLEAICFALTDLGYRASFEMKDLMAAPPGSRASEHMLYSADRILPCNPVTLTDYRKLVADVAGVRNAWIHQSEDYEVPIYCQEAGKSWRLTYDAEKGEELLPLKGLYRVLVEFEEDVKREGREEEIIGKVVGRLHRHRNLCEDFVSVSEIEYDLFSIDAEIKVSEGADIDRVNAEVYRVIRNLFSPAVNFYTLQQMQEKGYSNEEIFEGPLLQHGFIDTKELEGLSAGKDIRLSDIMSRITAIDGVIAIEKLAIPKESQSPFSEFTQWVGRLNDQEKTPRLDTRQSTIRFTRNGDRYRGASEKIADPQRVNAMLSFLLSSGQKVKLKMVDRGWEMPAGEYADAGAYFPFQRSLPACYGMEERYTDATGDQTGIAPDPSTSPHGPANHGPTLAIKQLDRRKKLVLQLRGFLLLFEQVLANYMSQLDHLPEFFSFDPSVQQTYFTQIPEGVQDLEALFVDFATYKKHAQELLENDHSRLKRRNKVLDHLLARMGETMDDQSAHARIFFRQKAAEKLIADKSAFLGDLVELTNYRGRGFDYTNPGSAWDTTNVAGVKKRICRLLGMRDYSRKYISSDALYISEVNHDNGIVRFVVRLEDPRDRQHLLLQSVEYEFRKEAETILTYLLERGMDRHLYEADERHEQSGYYIKRIAGEGIPERVAFRHFHHKDDMERSFERTLEVLNEFSGEENFHLLEHILLRPRSTGREMRPEKNSPGIDKENVALLPVVESETPVAGHSEKDKEEKDKREKTPYRFRILQVSATAGRSKEGWRLSLLNDEEEEIMAVSEPFLFYKHLTTRMDHLRSFGADKISYTINRNADGYYIFTIIDKGLTMAEGRKKYRDEEALDRELDKLVKYFSYERSIHAARATEEDEDRLAGLDPYSFHVSVFLPAWPLRFRDPGFRHLLEKTIFLEVPAHIYPHVYWLEHADMRRFEEAYRLWLMEQCNAAIPNTEILNNLLFVLDEIRKQ